MEIVLREARSEILKSWRETCELNKNHPQAAEIFNPDSLPDFHDPFAGGGSIPLEAQRLGLGSYASDLNPVAVTINKAMIEIPPKFAGVKPVGPLLPSQNQDRLTQSWPGATGMAEDVRRYGAWMRREAERRIGHLYPSVDITPQMVKERPDLARLVGQKLNVIAWLWARTVYSPNPAYSHTEVPLTSSFVLSVKPGKEAYIDPVIEGSSYQFKVRVGVPPENAEEGTKLSRGANFRCVMSNSPIEPSYIKAEGQAGRMGSRLMAIVAEGNGERVYISPSLDQESVAGMAKPEWRPKTALPNDPRNFWTIAYGLSTFADLFTPRQLVALNTFSQLIQEAITKCEYDARASGMNESSGDLAAGCNGALAYAQAVGVYLAIALSRLTDICNSLCRWETSKTQVRNLFGRQAIPMQWSYAENNVFGGAAGDYMVSLDNMVDALLRVPACGRGEAFCSGAQTQNLSFHRVVSTDPPYYDNIGYADLSDFFYVWLRRNLKPIFPGLFATLAVPKSEELVASPYRHNGKQEAESFFLGGMTAAIHNLAEHAHPAFPVTIYYAFKQSETSDLGGTSSVGWETFLASVLSAGFALTGTWPMRTELMNRMTGVDTNGLASSIVLVCRKRASDAPTTSRREFIRELNATLPEALVEMTGGGINSHVAPVDLSQAMIGPGMAIFSKYSSVLEADGTPMSVRTALQLINRFLAEDDFDHDTQFCLRWFEGHGWNEGKYGEADVLARAKGTSVDTLHRAGVLRSRGGDVALYRWTDLAAKSPDQGNDTPIWEALHYLIRALNTDGERAAGVLLARMPVVSGPVRTLAYRLYTLSERKGWAEDARPYNELIGAWTAIEIAANEIGPIETQAELF